MRRHTSLKISPSQRLLNSASSWSVQLSMHTFTCYGRYGYVFVATGGAAAGHWKQHCRVRRKENRFRMIAVCPVTNLSTARLGATLIPTLITCRYHAMHHDGTSPSLYVELMVACCGFVLLTVSPASQPFRVSAMPYCDSTMYE